MGQRESASFQSQKELPILCQPDVKFLCQYPSLQHSEQSLQTIYDNLYHQEYPSRSTACKRIYPFWQKQCPAYFKRVGGAMHHKNKDGVDIRLSHTLSEHWDGTSPETKLTLFDEIKQEVTTLANCIRENLSEPGMKNFALLDSQVKWKYLLVPGGPKPLQTAFDWLVLLSQLEDFRIHYLLQYDPANKHNFTPESSLRHYCNALKCKRLICRTPLSTTTQRPPRFPTDHTNHSKSISSELRVCWTMFLIFKFHFYTLKKKSNKNKPIEITNSKSSAMSSKQVIVTPIFDLKCSELEDRDQKSYIENCEEIYFIVV